MEFPYCEVDGIKYQLHFSEHGTLRFPKLKDDCPDLNQLIKNYYDDKIDLQVIWEEYTQTGSSYYLVDGIFSPYGMNNHTVTQGKGKCKKMILFSGDPDIDNSYNLTNEEMVIRDVQNIITKLYEDGVDNKEILKEKLDECLKLLND
jgi:hypothetical protein